MKKKDLIDYLNTSLGKSFIDVELTDADYDVIIRSAISVMAPYYEGRKFVQASGKVIDLSLYNPISVLQVYNCKEPSIMTAQEYAFGGSYVALFDSTILNRFISYVSYKMLYNELQYQKGMDWKWIAPNVYLDGFFDNVVIEMIVKPSTIEDIEDTSMFCPWVMKYSLALAKETLSRIRGKFTLVDSPYALDAAQLAAEAASEKAALESQLKGPIFIV